METFIIHPRDKSDVDLLLALVQKIGLDYEIVPEQRVEGIDPGMEAHLSDKNLVEKLEAAERAPVLEKQAFWKKIEGKWGDNIPD